MRLHLPRLMRYLVAGSLAAGVLFGSFYLIHDILGVWYLTASVIAFILTVVTSFTLQKLWVFGAREVAGSGIQFAKFITLSLFNLLVNTVLMYLFVDILSFNPFVALFLTTAIIAFYGFVIYLKVIFKPSSQNH